MTHGRATVVLYRTPHSAPLMVSIALASLDASVVHAHGPALHGLEGEDIAATIEALAEAHDREVRLWDGDAPVDAAGVDRLAGEVTAEMLIVEWQPRMVGGEEDLARRVLEAPPCDLLLVRPGSLSRLESVTVAVGPGPNAPLAAAVGQRMAHVFGVEARALRGVDDESEIENAQYLCTELMPDAHSRIEVGRDVVNLLVEAADDSGLLALGATEDLPLDRLGVRTVGTRLAHRADATVLVGRAEP